MRIINVFVRLNPVAIEKGRSLINETIPSIKDMVFCSINPNSIFTKGIQKNKNKSNPISKIKNEKAINAMFVSMK